MEGGPENVTIMKGVWLNVTLVRGRQNRLKLATKRVTILFNGPLHALSLLAVILLPRNDYTFVATFYGMAAQEKI